MWSRASSRSWLSATASGSLLALVSGFTTGAVGPAADSLAATYGVALASIGLLTTGLLLVHAVAQVPVGNWTDKLGPRRSGLIAVVVIIAGNLILAAAPNYGVALVVRAILGTGTAITLLAGSGFMRFGGDSALAQGWLGGMGIGGAGLAIALVPRLEPPLGWRAPFAADLLLAGAALAALAVAPSSRGPARLRVARLRSALHMGDSLLYRLALIHSGSYGVSLIAASWAVPLLTRDGYGLQEAGLAGSLILLGGIVSRPLGGWFVRMWIDHYAIVLLVGAAAAAAGLTLIVVPGTIWQRSVGCLLVGLAAGAPFGFVFNEAAVAKPGSPLMAVGFVNMIANLFVAGGVSVLGLLFLTPAHAGLGFLALALLSLLSVTALIGLRPPTAATRLTGAIPG